MMRRTGLIVAGCLMSLAFATVAQADTTPLGSTPLFATAESSQTCSAPLIENPFARFGDRRSYVMAPGGSFESTALHGWQLSGSAKRVAEADPVDLGANDGAGMLSLPAKTSAISPTMCVDFSYPTFRLLTKALSKGEFKIEITYPDVSRPVWEELKKFDGQQFTNAGSGWRLTDDIDMKVDLGGKTAGFRRVAFRFTALSGNWRVDDLYVDPRRRI
ncbi:MAG: hypothetical protein M3550_07650 [Actinomycetota bacterium]|nr:hypothetical protein [Actinomycetota bacterium]